jgi:hypothetical protein
MQLQPSLNHDTSAQVRIPLKNNARVQIKIVLNATAGVAGAERAVKGAGDIAGRLMLAAAAQTPPIPATTPVVTAIVVCGDGRCQVGEEVYKAGPNLDSACLGDCPVLIGECGAPDAGPGGRPVGGVRRQRLLPLARPHVRVRRGAPPRSPDACFSLVIRLLHLPTAGLAAALHLARLCQAACVPACSCATLTTPHLDLQPAPLLRCTWCLPA